MVSYYPSPNYILDVFFDCFYIQVELITDKITLNQVNVHGKPKNKPLFNINIKRFFFKDKTHHIPPKSTMTSLDKSYKSKDFNVAEYIKQQGSLCSSVRFTVQSKNYYPYDTLTSIMDSLQYYLFSTIPTKYRREKYFKSDEYKNYAQETIQLVHHKCQIVLSKNGL